MDMHHGSQDTATRQAQFLRLYSSTQRQIHGYIATFFHDPADVDEVMQETSIVLWRKFDAFDDRRDFAAWSCGIARLEVLRYMRQRRHSALPLDETAIGLISDERQAMDQELEARRVALGRCLKKLRDTDRALIERCYSGESSFKRVAQQLGRPINSVYKSLSRVRLTLLYCIRRTLEAGGSA